MSTQFVSMTEDRQALHDWEAAEKEAEARRSEWQGTLGDEWAGPFNQLRATEQAIAYAWAANNAALLKLRFEELVAEMWEIERLRERLADLAV